MYSMKRSGERLEALVLTHTTHVLTHVHTFIRVYTHLHKCTHKPACREHMHMHAYIVLIHTIKSKCFSCMVGIPRL